MVASPERNANRCSISANDCDEALKYLAALQELYKESKDTTSKNEALLIAAIVSYSRAFTKSWESDLSVGKIKVNLRKVFGNDQTKINLHKLIIEKRNKAVAHSDSEYHKSVKLDGTYTGIARMRPSVNYYEGIDIELFAEIADIMQKYFIAEQFKYDTGKN